MYSKATAETFWDAHAIITKFIAISPDKFKKIKEYADREDDLMDAIMSKLHADKSFSSEKLELERYRHTVGAILLEVSLVDEGNIDSSSEVVNEFFAILSNDKYPGVNAHIFKFGYVLLKLSLIYLSIVSYKVWRSSDSSCHSKSADVLR